MKFKSRQRGCWETGGWQPQSLAGHPPKGQTMASDKNLWLGILQDAATDLNAIIDEIATGYLIYQNIDDGHRSELEYLCHRINESGN